MTAILGISAFYHDSAAALVIDGDIVAAAQEERFTRRKHDPSFPSHAVEYCLAQAQRTPAQLDFVGFYEKPFLKFDRLIETYLQVRWQIVDVIAVMVRYRLRAYIDEKDHDPDPEHLLRAAVDVRF